MKKIREVLERVYQETMKYSEGVSHTPSTIDPEYIDDKVLPEAERNILAILNECVGEREDISMLRGSKLAKWIGRNEMQSEIRKRLDERMK